MVKALARAFRWRKLLETGAFGTIKELAAAEKINVSYVSRVLRRTSWRRSSLISLDCREGIRRTYPLAYPLPWAVWL